MNKMDFYKVLKPAIKTPDETAPQMKVKQKQRDIWIQSLQQNISQFI